MWTCEQLRYVPHVYLATCRIISAAASITRTPQPEFLTESYSNFTWSKYLTGLWIQKQFARVVSVTRDWWVCQAMDFGVFNYAFSPAWIGDSRMGEVSTEKKKEGNGQRPFTVTVHYSGHRNILPWRTPLGLHASKAARLRARGNDFRTPGTCAGYGRIYVRSR